MTQPEHECWPCLPRCQEPSPASPPCTSQQLCSSRNRGLGLFSQMWERSVQAPDFSVLRGLQCRLEGAVGWGRHGPGSRPALGWLCPCLHLRASATPRACTGSRQFVRVSGDDQVLSVFCTPLKLFGEKYGEGWVEQGEGPTPRCS